MKSMEIIKTTDADGKTRTGGAAQDGTLQTLRLPSFQWFLSGSVLTNAANWIQQITLNWLVYEITSSGALLGTLNLFSSIASVGLAPIAGVVIDRFSRRRLYHATNTWLLALSLGFGLALLGNATMIWPLFLFSFLSGVGQAFSVPLSQTMIFSVAPRRLTPNALALVQTGWALMRSVGPAIGGFLILWLGPAGNFFAQAAAYALVMVTIFKMRMPYEKEERQLARTSGSFKDGWNYIRSSRITLPLLLLSWVLPLLVIPNFNALPPIYAKDVFMGGPDTLGYLLAAVGVGGVVGGVVVNALGSFEQRGMVQLASLLLLGLSLIGFALSTELWLALIFLALAGLFEMIYLTTNAILLQLSIPPELRGRVMGIVSLRAGLAPVGALLAGFGADLVGPRWTTIIFSAMTAAIAVIVFLGSSTMRNYRLSQVMSQASGE